MDPKPPNIIYGLEDKPPLLATLLLASQHMVIAVSYAVFAVFVFTEIGADAQEIHTVTVMTLLASAIGITLQALKRGPVGSGYLATQNAGAMYIPASLSAGALGGRPSSGA